MKEGNISCASYYNIRPKSEETWKKQRQKEVNNREETRKRIMTFCRRQQDGSVDSVKQENQSYIAEDNKDTNESMDSIGRRKPIICTLT
jgi:beta-xylosidase